jgi:hypothetical protein
MRIIIHLTPQPHECCALMSVMCAELKYKDATQHLSTNEQQNNIIQFISYRQAKLRTEIFENNV